MEIPLLMMITTTIRLRLKMKTKMRAKAKITTACIRGGPRRGIGVPYVFTILQGLGAPERDKKRKKAFVSFLM